MKKAITLLLALVMMLLLCSCTYCERAEEGCFDILYGSYLPFQMRWNPDGACVHIYTWDGDESNTDIVIPDKYKDYKIKKLGGYYGSGLPSPFTIDVTTWMDMHDDNEDIHSNGCLAVPYDMFDDYSDEWSEIVYHDFNLYIGKNIDSVYGNPCAMVYTIDGVKTAYCPRVTVCCDEENETFYSKDGRLYYRENNELVDEFIYTE